MSPWILYSLLRLGLFAILFGALLALGIDWWWAAVIASIMALTVSYIFFSPLRAAVAADLHARRTRETVDPDAEAEDSAALEHPHHETKP